VSLGGGLALRELPSDVQKADPHSIPSRPLSNKRDRMAHLNCVMFLSPDPETLEWVKEELAKPKYGGYWLCACLPLLVHASLETDLVLRCSFSLLERLDKVDY
jgi:hypothetical protein